MILDLFAGLGNAVPPRLAANVLAALGVGSQLLVTPQQAAS